MILNPHPELNQHQNVITSRGSALARRYHVWSTSITTFVSCLALRRTDRQTHAHHSTRSASTQRRAAKRVIKSKGLGKSYPPRCVPGGSTMQRDVILLSRMSIYSNRISALRCFLWLLSRRWRKRGITRWCWPSVCLSLRLSRAYTKTHFSQKLFTLELWSLLRTIRKSYMGFSKNSSLHRYDDLGRQQISPRAPQRTTVKTSPPRNASGGGLLMTPINAPTCHDYDCMITITLVLSIFQWCVYRPTDWTD